MYNILSSAFTFICLVFKNTLLQFCDLFFTLSLCPFVCTVLYYGTVVYIVCALDQFFGRFGTLSVPGCRQLARGLAAIMKVCFWLK